MNEHKKHIFSLYVPGVSAQDSRFELKDPVLWQRIVRVLRLRTGDQVIFFDNMLSVQVELDASMFSDKRESLVAGCIIVSSKNQKLLPEIIFCPCVTKKDAFEVIIYAAAQMGVSQIIPVISQKSQRDGFTPKDMARMHKIMISACEQAGQFIIPEIQEPVLLPDLLSKISGSYAICFECGGKPAREILDITAQKLAVIQGPEGGLIDAEVDLLRAHNVQIYSLTPTVLRSQDAAPIGLGLIRSLKN